MPIGDWVIVGRAGNIPPLGLTAARLGCRIGRIATLRPYKSCLPSRLCCLSALVIGLLILSAGVEGELRLLHLELAEE